MVESIVSSLHQVKVMEQCIAVGIDSGEKISSVAAGRQEIFDKAVTKAKLTLGAAETFRTSSTLYSFHCPLPT